MKEEAIARLRCKPGDLVRVVVAVNPEMLGAVALVQRRRPDGRWNVLLDRSARGVTLRGGRVVETREFCFRDESLEPIAGIDELLRSRFSHLPGGRRLLDRGEEGEPEGL